jgi:multimeric flavodoxin WrbA
MILFLNSSPRKNGVTTTILKTILEGLKEGAPDKPGLYEWIDVNSLSIRPCIGCLKCRPDKICVLPEDDGHRIGDLIRNSIMLVIGTPVYWGNITRETWGRSFLNNLSYNKLFSYQRPSRYVM